MGKVIRNLIEYSGINDRQFSDLESFKQMNIDYTFTVPNTAPPIEHITKVRVKTQEVYRKVIQTPIGVSLEGQEATGFSIFLVGDIILNVEYSAKNREQSLHTITFKIPFCDYIVLPKNFNSGLMLFTYISVEDIFTESVDNRLIYNNISLLLVASYFD